MKKEISINYQGINLEVIVDYTGKYFPATVDEPEELPEVEVLKVYAGEMDILGIFYEEQILDIAELCEEQLRD